MHERRDAPGDEAVVDENVFLDAKRRIQPLEIPGVIAGGAMTQCQVLGPRRRADGIGLDESQPAQRAFQRDRGKQAAGDREPAQVVESNRHVPIYLAFSS